MTIPMICALFTACGGGAGGGDAGITEAMQTPTTSVVASAAVTILATAPATPQTAAPHDITFSSIASDSLPVLGTPAMSETAAALPMTAMATAATPVETTLTATTLGTLAPANVAAAAPVEAQAVTALASVTAPAASLLQFSQVAVAQESTTTVDTTASPVESTLKTIQAVVTTALLPTASDVIAELNASLPIDKQTWNGINCYGQVGSFSKLPDAAIVGNVLSDGSSLRFGRTQDPLVAGRTAFVFRVATQDTLFADSRRCEAVAYPVAPTAIPKGQNFWYALTLLVKDGGNSIGDGQLITQWHTTGYNPFMGLYLSNGKLHMTVRTSTVKNGSRATVTYSNPWVDQTPITAKWMTLIFNARVSHSAADQPFLRVWRDGRLIVDHRGPIGYNADALPYAKVGFYSWNDNNTWDTNTPIRTVYVRKAALVRDASAKFTAVNMKTWAELN